MLVRVDLVGHPPPDIPREQRVSDIEFLPDVGDSVSINAIMCGCEQIHPDGEVVRRTFTLPVLGKFAGTWICDLAVEVPERDEPEA